MSFDPQQPNNGRPMPPNYSQASGPQQPYTSQPGTGRSGPRSYGSAQPGYGRPGHGHPQPGYGQPGCVGPPPVGNPALFDSQMLPEAAYGPGSDRFWMVGEQERSAAMWAHLGTLVFGFMPLVMFLVKKDESPFVREHSRQGLNAMISNAIISSAAAFVLGILGFILALVTFGLGIFIVYGAVIVPIVYAVLYVIAAVAANRGEGYRFPLVFDFVK
ncbi:DUF4870 domain-containing protein [Brevibacterium renqingii]|uniref:DUF4870 domain-containing protein n=1 Tax=Brevibacterium renqingii TaxID=2776916 RepID=UPI001ADF9F02|nr:DUF4870 domain-containing protein [Brevibacterium renqingii]